MKQAPSPVDTLRICFEYAEDKYNITLDKQVGGPEAAMYNMAAARTMSQSPHAQFN